MFGNMHII